MKIVIGCFLSELLRDLSEVMNKLFLKIFVIGIITFSCVNHDEKKPVLLDGITIKIGQRCGWCAGYDSLILTKAESNYGYHPACAGKDKNEHEQTDANRWNALLDKLDFNTFKSINVNTCNLCADGCDTWISIQKDDDIHTIQFGYTSPEIQSIKSFIDALDAWRKDLKNK